MLFVSFKIKESEYAKLWTNKPGTTIVNSKSTGYTVALDFWVVWSGITSLYILGWVSLCNFSDWVEAPQSTILLKTGEITQTLIQLKLINNTITHAQDEGLRSLIKFAGWGSLVMDYLFKFGGWGSLVMDY